MIHGRVLSKQYMYVDGIGLQLPIQEVGDCIMWKDMPGCRTSSLSWRRPTTVLPLVGLEGKTSPTR